MSSGLKRIGFLITLCIILLFILLKFLVFEGEKLRLRSVENRGLGEQESLKDVPSELSVEALVKTAFDPLAPSAVRARALSLLPVADARKYEAELISLAGTTNPILQNAAVWSLGFIGGARAARTLEGIISQDDLHSDLRADAVVARAMASVHDVAFFERWLNEGPGEVRAAARFVSGKSREAEKSARPSSTSDWQKTVGLGGDSKRGRRLFFSPQLGCAKCHIAEGRGTSAGQDLSAIGRLTTRAKLIESIVEPSREISVDFQGYEIETKSGELLTGIKAQQKTNGEISMFTFDGRKISVAGREVDSFRKLNNSLMPDGLVEAMAIEEFRDLLAYMESLK